MSRMRKRKKRIRAVLGVAFLVIVVIGAAVVWSNKNKNTTTAVNNKEAAQKKENITPTNVAAATNTNTVSNSVNANTASTNNIVQTSKSTKINAVSKQTPIKKNVATFKKAAQNQSVSIVKQSTTQKQPVQIVKQSTTQKLSDTELNYFTNYFNDASNNGFLLCSYSEPEQINLNDVLYNGAGVSGAINVQNTEERSEYLKESGNEEIFAVLIKLTSQQIDNLLEQKANVKLSSVTKKLNWIYIDKYDAYYTQHGDSNYTKFRCTDGYKKDDGTYVINCNAQDELAAVYACTVTLNKEGNSYKFVANTITK